MKNFALAYKLKKLLIYIWFQKQNNLSLEIIRIGIGALLFITYGLSSKDLFIFYSDSGLIPREIIATQISDPLVNSILFYISEAWQLLLFYIVFLGSCLALALGVFTNWVKWIVLIGHLSIVYRNPAIYYGVDNILSSLLFIFCLAPIGKHYSWDRNRKIKKLQSSSNQAYILQTKSRWGFACTRLIQIQMATLFFYSGTTKLLSNVWWSGDALWLALLNYETFFMPVGWLATQYWFANILTYSTILVELAYPFLIWELKTRPYILTAAIILHLGIAIMLGMYYFALVMICGHLAFARSEWIIKWLEYIGSIKRFGLERANIS